MDIIEIIRMVLMWLIGFGLIYLAVKKEYEPTLLLPMGFGAILVNLPNTGVLNQMMPGIGEVRGIIQWLYEVGIEASEAMPILLFTGIYFFKLLLIFFVLTGYLFYNCTVCPDNNRNNYVNSDKY